MAKRSPEGIAEELRDLIREANGTIGELSRLLRECRNVIASGAQQARDQTAKAADDELGKWYEKIQEEMNRNSARLNKAVDEAREVVIKQLTIARIEKTPDGYSLHWERGRFMDDAEVTKT